jgi:predicted PurR-regulated permease PerM
VPDEPGVSPEDERRLPDFEALVPPPAELVVELDPMSVLSVAVVLLATAALLALVHAAPGTFLRVSIGVLLAMALNPIVLAVQRRLHCRRAAAVVIVGLSLVVFFVSVAVFLGPRAVKQAAEFGSELPDTLRGFYSFPIIGPKLANADAAARVQDWINQLPTRIDDQTVAAAVNRFVGGLFTALTVSLITFAVLLDGERLTARMRALVPERARESADWAGRVLYRTIGRYFAGSLIVASLNGLGVLTMGLILGVPLAPVAGLWAAITNLIPQIGGFLGGSFFVLLAFTQGPVVGLIALAFFLLYQQFENHLVYPAVVGQAVNLSPPTTLIAALVGGAAAGIPGALIATPLVGTVKAMYLEFRAGRAGRPAPVPVPRGRLVRAWQTRRARHRPG